MLRGRGGPPPFSPLNVVLFLNRSYFGEKGSGTSSVTAVIYAGTTQSLNGLAREFLPHELFSLRHFQAGDVQQTVTLLALNVPIFL